MATDFWASSHYTRWVVDRMSLKQARAEDMVYVDDSQFFGFLDICFANVIAKLGKKLSLRQRAIATATVFFRRFYLKNLYCETDPFIVIAACCYVAAKAEESPVHIKTVVSEARALFNQEQYGVKNFPSDTSKLAEMEFYLMDDLGCDLTVFHPYRTLMTLCCREGAPVVLGADAEAGELGAGVDDGPRYWGTGEGRLELHEGALQMAWFIINDTYRSELCLLYPPHLIAIAALTLTISLHSSVTVPSSSQTDQRTTADPAPVRRSSRSSSHARDKKTTQDAVGFLAGLSVSMPLVATIVQEIVALYTLWARYREDGVPDGSGASLSATAAGSPAGSGSSRSLFGTPLATPTKRGGAGAFARTASAASSQAPETPSASSVYEGASVSELQVVTPAYLMLMLARMREARAADLAAQTQQARTPTIGQGPGFAGHSGHGRRMGLAVNKRLERAQAAG